MTPTIIPTISLQQIAPFLSSENQQVTIYMTQVGFGRGCFVRYEHDAEKDTITFYNERNNVALVITDISHAVRDDAQFVVQFTEQHVFIVTSPKNYTGEMPRFMHEEDYRFAGEERCEHVIARIETLLAPAPILNARCVQVSGHAGEHMIVSDNITMTVDKYDRPTNGTRDVFGFRYRCSSCQRVDVKSNDSDFVLPGLCFTCSFWTHIYNEKDEHFIIDGHSYAPGKGGFGGRTFRVESADGRTFSGELFTQGEVPPHFRAMLPDDAVFMECPQEKRHLRLV